MGCGSSTEADAPNKAAAPLPGKTGRNNEDVEQIELTEGVVQEYIQLEKSIHRLEKKNVLKKYEAKMLHADSLKKTVDQLEATYKELKKQTEKEKADVDNIEQPSVRAFLKQQGTWEAKFNKEQQEYLDCLNKQEVAEKELQGAKQGYERAAKIAEAYKKRSDRLSELYDKQDRLLAGIFGGEYGSDLENTLEAQLDDALEWQQRISLAKFKWTNGRVLLVHACTQMAFGIKRWKELETIEMSNTRMRYFAAAEGRNNFIAAGQNVQSCRVYLGKVKFPYCTEEEMAGMESAVNSAFNDIQSKDKYGKSLDIYQNVHKRVAALIQWFDQVINETILKDLNKANTEVSQIQKELRTERMRLIKEKVRETLGRDLDVEYDEVSDDDDDDAELLALEAEKVGDAGDLPGKDLSSIMAMSQPDSRIPSPLPQSELAAAPTSEDLFGNVANIKKEHEKQRADLEKAQEVARMKNDNSLQAKLEQRRQQAKRRSHVDRQKGKSNAAPAPAPAK